MKINPAIVAIIADCRCEGNALYLPAGKLDRKVYQDVDAALKLAGGKWNRSAKAHLFEGDAWDAIESLVQTGEIVDAKREFNAFFTPRLLAAEVCELAGIGPGMTVLEPSAGDGALALQAADLGAVVTAIEIQPNLAAALKNTGRLAHVFCADFLGADRGKLGKFDRVVMNPPFARQADINHVMNALGFVKPGGSLVAIMSASVLFRDNLLTKAFRESVTAAGGSITRLPDGSFKESGTMVNTALVIIPC